MCKWEPMVNFPNSAKCLSPGINTSASNFTKSIIINDNGTLHVLQNAISEGSQQSRLTILIHKINPKSNGTSTSL